MIGDRPDDSDDVGGPMGSNGPMPTGGPTPTSGSGPEDSTPDDMADAGSMGSNGLGSTDGPAREPRPMIERLGLAGVAAVLAALFGGVGLAAWSGGEPFLAVMGGIGCLMTAWVGGMTLFRG